MMREAADRGIPCLAVTDRLTSPAAQLARVGQLQLVRDVLDFFRDQRFVEDELIAGPA